MSGLVVTIQSDGSESVLTYLPLKYEIRGFEFTVPAGFRTDLASVPFPFNAFFPKLGRYAHAAVLHDFLLEEGILSRKECDRLFIEVMQQDGVSSTRSRLMYWGVRLYATIRRLK